MCKESQTTLLRNLENPRATFTEFRLEIVVRDTPKRKAHPLPTGPAARPHSLPTGPVRPHMDDTNMLDILDKEITDIVLQHGQVPKDPSVLDLYSSKLRQRVKMQQRLIQSQKKIMKAHSQRDNTPPLHSGQAVIVCDVPQDTAAKLPRNSYDWVTTLGALRVHNIADAVMHTNNEQGEVRQPLQLSSRAHFVRI